MKKILFFVFLFSLLWNTTSAYQGALPEVYIYDVKTDKTVYSPGEIVKGSFLLENYDNIVAPNIYYQVRLTGDYEGTTPLTIYSQSEMIGSLTLAGREKQTVSFEYGLPKTLAGKGFGIQIQSMLKTGAGMGWGNTNFDIEGDNKFIFVKDASVVTSASSTKTYFLQEGPMVYEGEKIYLNVEFDNTGNLQEIYPKLTVYDRSEARETLLTRDEEVINVKAKAVTKSQFELPVFDYVPRVYVGKLEFFDKEGQQIAGTQDFRYIIFGQMVTINNVIADKEYANKGETVNLTVDITGAPFDINNFNVATSTGLVSIKIFNEKSQLVGESLNTAVDFGQIEIKNYPIEITEKAKTLKAEVKVVGADGLLLGETTVNLTKNPMPKKGFVDFLKSPVFYSLLAIVILALLVYFLRKKNKQVVAVLVLAIIISAGVWLGLSKTYEADAYVVLERSTHRYDFEFFLNYPRPGQLFSPGEEITVQANAVLRGCSNVTRDTNLTIWNNDSLDSVTAISSASNSLFSFPNFPLARTLGNQRLNTYFVWKYGDRNYERGYQPYGTVGDVYCTESTDVYLNVNIEAYGNYDSNGTTTPNTNMSDEIYAGGNYVGTGSVQIPLIQNGITINDNDDIVNVPGLHIRRKAGYVQFEAYGENTKASREVVIGNFNFTNATTTGLVNVTPERYSFDGYHNGTCGITVGTTKLPIVANPNVKNAVAANDEFTLTADNLGGNFCSITAGDSDMMKVGYTPITDENNRLFITMSASSTSNIVPTNVIWTAIAGGGDTGGSYAYNWGGTDGLVGNTASVLKTYTSHGSKIATTTVSKGGHSLTCLNNIELSENVIPNLLVQCGVNLETFTSSSTATTTVVWGAQATGGGGQPSYSYVWDIPGVNEDVATSTPSLAVGRFTAVSATTTVNGTVTVTSTTTPGTTVTATANCPTVTIYPPPPPPPLPPSDVPLLVGDTSQTCGGKVDLSWNSIPDATFYKIYKNNIYQNKTKNTNYTILASSGDYFEVSSAIGETESSRSNQVYPTPSGACSPSSYSCTGTIPPGMSVCQGDEDGRSPNPNTEWQEGCTSERKCQFYSSSITPPDPNELACGVILVGEDDDLVNINIGTEWQVTENYEGEYNIFRRVIVNVPDTDTPWIQNNSNPWYKIFTSIGRKTMEVKLVWTDGSLEVTGPVCFKEVTVVQSGGDANEI